MSDVVQVLEQVSTSMDNIAEVLSNYYMSLRRKGVPQELAEELTNQYSRIFWESMYKENE